MFSNKYRRITASTTKFSSKEIQVLAFGYQNLREINEIQKWVFLNFEDIWILYVFFPQ